MKRKPMRSQRGAAMVAFALSALLLFTALFGAMEVGRVLWTWNAAVDALRVGSRLAATCDQDASGIKARMRERLPGLSNDQVTLSYTNPGGMPNCDSTNCQLVTVALANYSHDMLLLPTVSVPMPAFTTTLPREVMNSSTHSAECN